MQEEKKLLRAAIKRSCKTAPADQAEVIERIERLPAFASARTVALYHALPDEVPTAEMLSRWVGHKRLALPVIVDGGTPVAGTTAGGVCDGTIVFREYTREADMREGAFGIGEPCEGAVVPPEEIDLMLVPGVAFDAAGGRLGRGKGFYDRYLSRTDAAHIYKVGLCRPGALVPEVPAEAHDVKMDKIFFGY